MDDLDLAILNLRNQNKNCSQIIITLFNDYRGVESEDFVKAVFALGNGLQFRKTCGILSACICALSSTMDQLDIMTTKKYKAFVLEFSIWFHEEFGATDCINLVENYPSDTITICSEMLKKSYIKLIEFIEEKGIEVN